MQVDIYQEPSDFELRLYVACHTDSKESAKKIEALLNNTENLNHIGLAEQLPNREDWTVKAFCQIHTDNDGHDRSLDDPGPGSVFDVFKGILKAVHDSEEFVATISPHVREMLNEENVKTWSEEWFTQVNPQLVGIDKLAEILHEADLNDVPAVLKKLGVDAPEKQKSGSPLPYLIGGLAVIACLTLAIYLVRANHLARVNNPVKIGS